jgi:hypothetical protein
MALTRRGRSMSPSRRRTRQQGQPGALQRQPGTGRTRWSTGYLVSIRQAHRWLDFIIHVRHRHLGRRHRPITLLFQLLIRRQPVRTLFARMECPVPARPSAFAVTAAPAGGEPLEYFNSVACSEQGASSTRASSPDWCWRRDGLVQCCRNHRPVRFLAEALPCPLLPGADDPGPQLPLPLAQLLRRAHNQRRHIPVAWVCVAEDLRRVEEAETSLAARLTDFLPIVGVIPKGPRRPGLPGQGSGSPPSGRGHGRAAAALLEVSGPCHR